MKTTTLVLILFLTGLDLWAQETPIRQTPRRLHASTNAPAALPTMPSFPSAPATSTTPTPQPEAALADTTIDATTSVTPAANQPAEEMIPAGNINFQGVDVNQVLDVYAKLVGRTLLRAGLPAATIVLQTQTPLTKSEAIQALQAVLALNGIAVVNIGDKFVKVLPNDQAGGAGAEFNNKEAGQLPDLGTYVTRIVQLKYTKPTEMVPIITPFAKLANSILPIDSNGILVLRDNAENVKRMLQMIDQVDVSIPAEYISEVIPIRYALAEDIANALNSLGGSGGASTVSIGSSGATTATGAARPGGTTAPGLGGINNQGNQPRQFGTQAATPGAPASGTTFQQRLQNIINRAGASGQQDQIQVFGQAKIIADQRANSLLVFATRSDLQKIKEVVGKLDVLLSQVLIESIIMNVTLGNNFSLGVSAAQNPKVVNGSNPQVTTAGGFKNGPTFFNFLQNSLGTNTSSVFGNNLSSGFNYFGNIGPTWDVAVQAAESDSSTTIIQRPRIQTSQAKAATFFVGQTVPYITSTYNNGVNGNSSSYSQLSVGVQLTVTPFINPDGLVVMDIDQEIDSLGEAVKIDDNDVYKTIKRTLNSEIAVKDRDTIMLGGFIESDKTKSKSGVPFLQDIPLLGALFSQRSTVKNRAETIVLIRPTVLKTPELAAKQAIIEQQRLPGISAAAAQDIKDEQKQIERQRKLGNMRPEPKASTSPFLPYSPDGMPDTNSDGSTY